MKKLLLLAVFTLSVPLLWSQNESEPSSKAGLEEDRRFRIPLIGEVAPSFTAESTNGKINFPTDFGRKWKLLFSHPQDFTPVCSTEILELGYLQSEFEKLGIQIVVVSADPLESHIQWKKSLEELNLNNRGAIKIKFPLVEDENVAISKAYGMIHPETNATKSVRGVFIIDPDNVIQSIFFYPMTIGRNTDELIRTVAALQTTKASKDLLTPVNWKPGQDLLVSIPPKTDATKSAEVPAGYYSPVWYLWFKKPNH